MAWPAISSARRSTSAISAWRSSATAACCAGLPGRASGRARAPASSRSCLRGWMRPSPGSRLARVAGPLDGLHQLGPEPQHDVAVHLRDRHRQHAGAGAAAALRRAGYSSRQAVGAEQVFAARRDPVRQLAHLLAAAACRRWSSSVSFSTTAAPVGVAPAVQQRARARPAAAACRRSPPSAPPAASTRWCSASRCGHVARCLPAPGSAATAAGPGARRPRASGTAGGAAAWSWQEISPHRRPRDHDGHRHRGGGAHVAHVFQVHRRDAAQGGEAQVEARRVRRRRPRPAAAPARSWRPGSGGCG